MYVKKYRLLILLKHDELLITNVSFSYGMYSFKDLGNSNFVKISF